MILEKRPTVSRETIVKECESLINVPEIRSGLLRMLQIDLECALGHEGVEVELPSALDEEYEISDKLVSDLKSHARRIKDTKAFLKDYKIQEEESEEVKNARIEKAKALLSTILGAYSD